MRSIAITLITAYSLTFSQAVAARTWFTPDAVTPATIAVGDSAAAPPQLVAMTTGKKVVLLAGAAALYYMYKHHQTAQSGQPQYYLSRNGRVYYRDATHRAHWVTPPQGGIQVPADEARQYSDYKGYDNRSQGRDLTGLGRD